MKRAPDFYHDGRANGIREAIELIKRLKQTKWGYDEIYELEMLLKQPEQDLTIDELDEQIKKVPKVIRENL